MSVRGKHVGEGIVLHLLIHTAELERGLWPTVNDAVDHPALQRYGAWSTPGNLIQHDKQHLDKTLTLRQLTHSKNWLQKSAP